MTDIHSHLLYDVDDGTLTIEESIELIKLLYNKGINKIILTPHFIKDSNYSVEKKDNEKKLKILQNELDKNNIKVELYLGNEIFIYDTLIEDLNNNICSSLNNTNYCLIELPLRDQINNIEDILYNIKQKGFVPIIAHPERYAYFKDNHNLIDNIKKEGYLFQCNYSSINGFYGKRAKKLLKWLLKKKYVDFLATDFHKNSDIPNINNLNKFQKKIKRIAGNKYYKKILANSDKLVS